MRNSTMCLKGVPEGENGKNGREEKFLMLWFQVFKNRKNIMNPLIVKACQVLSKINKCNSIP